MRPRFRWRDEGVELRLPADEIEALGMVNELLASVGTHEGDPAARRLAVPAYPDDTEANEEFERLMGPELDTSRVADRSAVETTLEEARRSSVILSPSEAEAWLLVLNEARLALAARLGIEEEGWGEDEAALASNPTLAFLHYLTYLHGELTMVLMERL